MEFVHARGFEVQGHWIFGGFRVWAEFGRGVGGGFGECLAA